MECDMYRGFEDRKRILEELSIEDSVFPFSEFYKLKSAEVPDCLIAEAVYKARSNFRKYSEMPEMTEISVDGDSNGSPVLHFYGTYNNGKGDINIHYSYFTGYYDKLRKYFERIKREYPEEQVKIVESDPPLSLKEAAIEAHP